MPFAPKSNVINDKFYRHHLLCSDNRSIIEQVQAGIATAFGRKKNAHHALPVQTLLFMSQLTHDQFATVPLINQGAGVFTTAIPAEVSVVYDGTARGEVRISPNFNFAMQVDPLTGVNQVYHFDAPLYGGTLQQYDIVTFDLMPHGTQMYRLGPRDKPFHYVQSREDPIDCSFAATVETGTIPSPAYTLLRIVNHNSVPGGEDYYNHTYLMDKAQYQQALAAAYQKKSLILYNSLYLEL